MILTDIHTHSTFSADGRSSLTDMVQCAKEKQIRYFGVSEHFDYDYREQNILAQGKFVPQIDAAAYFSAARKMQKQESNDRFTLLVGSEFGFAPLMSCYQAYEEVIERYHPDFVVNSVHTCDGKDCYFTEYFKGKEKRYAYERYLSRVRESLDAPYYYDIVSHLGYVSRNATYPDPKLRYEEYADILDDILLTIVKKQKILEVNSSAKTAGSEFLPDTDILSRYFELGGRKVSFASDAHDSFRIADKRETVCRALKAIGFTHITVSTPAGELEIPI